MDAFPIPPPPPAPPGPPADDDAVPCLAVTGGWALLSALTLRLDLPPTLTFFVGVLLGVVLVFSLLIALSRK